MPAFQSTPMRTSVWPGLRPAGLTSAEGRGLFDRAADLEGTECRLDFVAPPLRLRWVRLHQRLIFPWLSFHQNPGPSLHRPEMRFKSSLSPSTTLTPVSLKNTLYLPPSKFSI